MSAVRFVGLVRLGLGARVPPLGRRSRSTRASGSPCCVNFDAGSATDIEGRVFARAFRQHTRRAAAGDRAEHRGRGRQQWHAVSRRGVPRRTEPRSAISPAAHRTSPASRISSDMISATMSSSAFRAAPLSIMCAPTCRPASSSRLIILKAQGRRLGRHCGNHRGRDLAIRLVLDILGCRSATSAAIAAVRARAAGATQRSEVPFLR